MLIQKLSLLLCYILFVMELYLNRNCGWCIKTCKQVVMYESPNISAGFVADFFTLEHIDVFILFLMIPKIQFYQSSCGGLVCKGVSFSFSKKIQFYHMQEFLPQFLSFAVNLPRIPQEFFRFFYVTAYLHVIIPHIVCTDMVNFS